LCGNVGIYTEGIMTRTLTLPIKSNQILLTFADKETADHVKLICRRKVTSLESYIIDNFEWDGEPECFGDEMIDYSMCSHCDYSDKCPDSKTLECIKDTEDHK
jgi:hypothetical protein